MNGIARRGAALALALVLPMHARAMDVLPLTVDEVTDRAASILHGRVVAIAPGRDADGIAATWVTLEVAECVKGDAGRHLTFKQLGVAEPLADGALFRLPGLPRYRAGEEVVLFLHEPSERGFTSPVGLAQGVMRVESEHGERLVRDARRPGTKQALTAFLDRVRRRLGR